MRIQPDFVLSFNFYLRTSLSFFTESDFLIKNFSICLWFQGDPANSKSDPTLRKARMLSLTGDRNLTLDTMRDGNDQFVGFDVNINDYSAGIIFG